MLASDHDDGEIDRGIGLTQGFQDSQAIHPRHGDIEQDEIDFVCADQLQGLPAAGGNLRRVALVL